MTTKSLVAVLAGAAAALGVIAIVILALLPMKTTSYDCGTVFASSDTWTYDSHRKDPSDYFDVGMDPELSVELGIDDMMADLNRGSQAYEACLARHSDRELILYVLISATVIFAAVSLVIVIRSRRNPPTPSTAE